MDNYHRDSERIRRVLIPAVKKSNIAPGDRESIIRILEARAFRGDINES